MSLTPRQKKKGKRGTITVWSTEGRDLRSVASEALYVGSPEHKAYVNPVLGEAPHPRSDKSQCEKFPAAMWCQFTRLLRISVEMGCTGDQMDAGGWPRYVWGWFDGQMFEARHRTDPPGNRYKGWLLEPDEYPDDPSGRLIALRERLERE